MNEDYKRLDVNNNSSNEETISECDIASAE